MRHEHEAENEGLGGLGPADSYKQDLEDSTEEIESSKEPAEKVFTMFGEYGLLKVSDSIQDDMNQLDLLEREHGYILVGQTEEYFIVHKGAKK